MHETLANGVQIVRWPHRHALPEREVLAFFEARGVPATRWTNAPGSVYEVHHHSYRKTLFCLEGTITFSLPNLRTEVSLAPGDRLILPPGTHHGAVVGPSGVTCIEGGGS